MDYNDFKNCVINETPVNEDDIKNFLYSYLNRLPVPMVDVNKNTFIERAVEIDISKGTFALSRLLYIPENIKHYATKGRFNNSSEPHFYGAFTDLENPSATRYFLACEIDQSLSSKQDKSFKFTVSKWLSINSFKAILFMFKSDFCNNNLIKSSYDSLTSSSEFLALSPEQKELFELLTIEIAKPKSKNEYLITNLLFDFYKKEKGFQSIIYPGIPARYKGVNIVMTPQIFETNFSFFIGAEFTLTQTKKENNIRISENYKIKNVNNTLIYSEFGSDEIGENIIIEK